MRTICILVYVLFNHYYCLMLKKECSHDELYKSCSFYEEYTCWETEELNKRVKSIPNKLHHCIAGCFCNKGLVRAYPNGKCIISLSCRDQDLLASLKKIPNNKDNF